MTLLSNRIGDYYYISQGKTRIPGVNDSSEMEETDVSPFSSCGHLDIRSLSTSAFWTLFFSNQFINFYSMEIIALKGFHSKELTS